MLIRELSDFMTLAQTLALSRLTHSLTIATIVKLHPYPPSHRRYAYRSLIQVFTLIILFGHWMACGWSLTYYLGRGLNSEEEVGGAARRDAARCGVVWRGAA